MLRHYKFMVDKTKYTFYIPIHDPVPFQDDTDVLSQILKYLKERNIPRKDVLILQTSTQKLRIPLLTDRKSVV